MKEKKINPKKKKIDVFHYNNHPIRRAQILGTLVSVNRRQKNIEYIGFLSFLFFLNFWFCKIFIHSFIIPPKKLMIVLVY